MKKAHILLWNLLLAIPLMFTLTSSVAQTTKDTVKTGKANDPMVVDPGMPDDSMAVKPAIPNDEMAALTDTGFISKNIMDNIEEIRLSKLGQSKGRSAQVKRAAALMVRDHTAILNDLKKLAANKGISEHSYEHEMQSMPMNIASGSTLIKPGLLTCLPCMKQKLLNWRIISL
ncbi:MAG: DUF4142 domain-containing protein [Segetibacter sp.]